MQVLGRRAESARLHEGNLACTLLLILPFDGNTWVPPRLTPTYLFLFSAAKHDQGSAVALARLTAARSCSVVE